MGGTREPIFTVTVHALDGVENKQVVSSLDVLRDILEPHLTDGLSASRIEISTTEPVRMSTRVQIGELVRELESSWYGGEFVDADDRVEIAETFTEGLSWLDCDEETIHVALWVTPRRFVLTPLSTESISSVIARVLVSQ